MQLRFARSATRRRIPRTSTRYVIEHCGLHFEQSPPPDSAGAGDTRLVFVGDAPEGAALEVMAVELENDELLLIRSMPMLELYRTAYEEAKRWRT
jgi:hypothetical protein